MGMDDCRKEDAVGVAAGSGAVVWNVKPEYCRCSSWLALPCRPSFSGVPIQLN